MGKQLTVWNSRMPVVDRYGKPVCVGDRIRAQVCVGRYGQTKIHEGVVCEQSKEAPAHAQYSQLLFRTDGGKLEYAGVEYGGSNSTVGKCYRNHEDFEHGHESWVEVR